MFSNLFIKLRSLRHYYLRSVILLLVLLILFSIYLFWLFIGLAGKISLNHFELFLGKSYEQIEETGGILEKGSSVDPDDLYTFFLFSNVRKNGHLRSSDLYKKFYPSSEKKSSLIFLDKTWEVPSVISNHCEEIYCFQHRVDFSALPAGLWKGLIGTEDYRFLEHKGIDVKSLLRALFANLKALRFIQGGSTLSQQLVKNLFLTRERTIHRKLIEIMATLWIEGKYSKQEIITAYFNEVEWGVVQGIRCKGIYSASLFYFAKTPRELEPFEIAILISLLKGPEYFAPIKHIDRLQKRTHYVFNKLFELGLLSDYEKSKQWNLNNWKKFKDRLIYEEKFRRFFSFWELMWVKANPSSVSKLEDFELYTFIVQARIFLKKIQENEDKNFSIKASFWDVEKKLFSFTWYSSLERDKKNAFENEKHQIGSLVKPFIFRVFLDYGVNPNQEVETGPVSLKLKKAVWNPRDASKINVSKVLVKEAFQHSLNRSIIRVAENVGLQNVEKGLKFYFPKIKTPLSDYPSQLIGSIEMSFADFFESFSGLIVKDCPWWWNEADRSVFFHLSNLKKATVRKMLKMEYREFFGKTGTTNNGLDNWFLGFDGGRADLIWVGLDGDRRGKKHNLSGANSSFLIYQNYLMRRGKLTRSFKCPQF